MSNKKQKSMIISTLVLFFGIIVIALYCFIPTKKVEVLETYKIVFDTDGGSSIAAIEIEEWDSTNLPENPTKEGYIFVGWMLGDELYDFSQGVNEDITLRAGWKKVEPDKVYYTVIFDTDGGTTYANQVIEEGDVATRPDTYPVKDGFTFIGWQVDGVDYNFNDPVTSDLTITAVWEANQVEEPPVDPDPNEPEKTYTVRFDANGGTLGNGCGAQTVKERTKANNSCRVSRNGYTFTGWSPNINSNITRDTTFRAQWQQNAVTPPPVVNVNASFYSNGGVFSGGAIVQNKTVASGTTIAGAGPSTPTRAHYSFAGWALKSGGKVDNSFKIDSTIKDFYATWSLKSFTATCDGTGRANFDPQCVIKVLDSSGVAYNSTFNVISNSGVNLGTFKNGDLVPVRKNGNYSVSFTFEGKNVNAEGKVVG